MKKYYLFYIVIWIICSLIVFSQDKIDLNELYGHDPVVLKLERKNEDKAVLNLSGITFIPDKNIFMGIENAQVQDNETINLARIYVIDAKDLKSSKSIISLNVIKLKDFSAESMNQNPGSQNDFEDIVFMDMMDGLPRIALVNEIGEVYLTVIDPSMKGSLTPKDFKKIIFNDGSDNKRKIAENKGSEGISYDPQTKTFYVVNEGPQDQATLRIESFQLPDFKNEQSVNISKKVKIHGEMTRTLLKKNDENYLPVQDLSGVMFNPDRESLFILSDDSNAVYEMSVQGKLLGVMKLPDEVKVEGKKENLQAEGITMDEEGSLIIASEPNIILNFKMSH